MVEQKRKTDKDSPLSWCNNEIGTCWNPVWEGKEGSGSTDFNTSVKFRTKLLDKFSLCIICTIQVNYNVAGLSKSYLILPRCRVRLNKVAHAWKIHFKYTMPSLGSNWKHLTKAPKHPGGARIEFLIQWLKYGIST